eukprot:Hpha_TRINITY_DN15583_c3_g11::TRINITY_DN15583_c3_g11_i1::g.104026::m.104026
MCGSRDAPPGTAPLSTAGVSALWANVEVARPASKMGAPGGKLAVTNVTDETPSHGHLCGSQFVPHGARVERGARPLYSYRQFRDPVHGDLKVQQAILRVLVPLALLLHRLVPDLDFEEGLCHLFPVLWHQANGPQLCAVPIPEINLLHTGLLRCPSDLTSWPDDDVQIRAPVAGSADTDLSGTGRCRDDTELSRLLHRGVVDGVRPVGVVAKPPDELTDSGQKLRQVHVPEFAGERARLELQSPSIRQDVHWVRVVRGTHRGERHQLTVVVSPGRGGGNGEEVDVSGVLSGSFLEGPPHVGVTRPHNTQVVPLQHRARGSVCAQSLRLRRTELTEAHEELLGSRESLQLSLRASTAGTADLLARAAAERNTRRRLRTGSALNRGAVSLGHSMTTAAALHLSPPQVPYSLRVHILLPHQTEVVLVLCAELPVPSEVLRQEWLLRAAGQIGLLDYPRIGGVKRRPCGTVILPLPLGHCSGRRHRVSWLFTVAVLLSNQLLLLFR